MSLHNLSRKINTIVLGKVWGGKNAKSINHLEMFRPVARDKQLGQPVCSRKNSNK
jgi:hypothetical protein